jgi:SAM-dependent methyltransferase
MECAVPAGSGSPISKRVDTSSERAFHMSQLLNWLKSLYHRLPEPPSSLYCIRGASLDLPGLVPKNAVIYDIGSKSATGNYFGAYPEDSKIISVDIMEGPGVDLVADAHDLHMVADNSVDVVTSVSVMEHVRNPWKVVDEIYRILKPGGIICIDVPFIFPYHADPDDFYRFSNRGILNLCEKFECLQNGFSRGPASTMHHLLVHFFAILLSFNSRTIYGINVDLFKWLFFWIKYLDKFIGNYSMAYVIHTGTYFVGRKPLSS